MQSELKELYKRIQNMKGIETKLDLAWANKVKSIGFCEYCKRTDTLNAHHIYSRSKKSVRWDLDNGICLCVSHHVFSSTFSAHKTPTEFTEWVKGYRGEVWYYFLMQKANQTVKLHKHEREELLKSLL